MRLLTPVLRRAPALCGLALCFAASGALAQPGPEMARVIVKLKSPAAADSAAATAPPSPVQGLAHRLGMTMRERAGPTERTHVVTVRGLDSRQLAQRLARDSEVEYAVPDERRHLLSAPNDPRYAAGSAIPGGPAAGQWYLRAPQGDVQSSINVEGAWAALEGQSRRIVVAVLDSGVRFDHPDLQSFADGGNLLPGYDFVTDPFIDNDDKPGRDSDASDPGDWVTALDLASNAAASVGCTVLQGAEEAPSSWHGTQTAGLIAAATHNALGMAGMTGAGRNVLVLPVRVLGKCGGFDSDIIPAMRWAAGLSVPGVPSNPNPARVISLSLGGEGACGRAYQDAIREIN